ncbi:hypothetical protein AYI70_g11846 [Smittium culicis]|uniref:Uncharacterized protein n=1 Tax=Smittium culicis TaxID=133412 RepID=A0A1R1X041_9FUNG|nr:hypothetical protein AYI70_g11846 [Smittium culicis]
MSAESDMPKIRLDSKEDFHFVKSNFSSLIEKCLESSSTIQNLKLEDSVKESLKTVLLKELFKWSDEVWKNVGSNSLVNGLPFEQAILDYQVFSDSTRSKIGVKTPADEFEPHDDKLAKEVADLQAEADNLLLKIAKKRKRNFYNENSDPLNKLKQIKSIIEPHSQSTNDPLNQDSQKLDSADNQYSSTNSMSDLINVNASHNTHKNSLQSTKLSKDFKDICNKLNFVSNSLQLSYNELETVKNDLSIVKNSKKFERDGPENSSSTWLRDLPNLSSSSSNNGNSSIPNNLSNNKKQQQFTNQNPKSYKYFANSLD